MKYSSLLILALVSLTTSFARPAFADQPETVMITLHAKPSAEKDLARVLAHHEEIVRRLKLIASAPYMTLRGIEPSGATYFVIVMTWRDASVPDHAPSELLAVWQDMRRLVEARNGRPGLDISEMTVADF